MKAEKSITETVASQLEELHTTFAAAVEELNVERAGLETESQEILKAADELRLLLPAQAREAQRAADALLVAGKREKAQAKLEEQQRAEAAPAGMEQRRSDIARRIEAIGNEKKVIARKVFKLWIQDARVPGIEAQRKVCADLDLMWQGIIAFAQETGAHRLQRPLVTASLQADLVARDHGPEKAVFLKLREWFGFGGKQ